MTEIQFKVKLKASLPAIPKDAKAFNTEAYKRIIAFGINPTRARKAMSQFSPQEIDAATDLLEKRLKAPNLQKVSSAEAYFFDALKKGYAPPPTPVPVTGTQDAAATVQKLKDDIKAAYDAQRLGNAERLYLELDETEQTQLREEFVQTQTEVSAAGSALKLFRSKGFKSKTASAMFFAWYARKTWGDASEMDLLNFAIQSGMVAPAK